VVNYAEGERQHVQTEFAFDINEVAHHRMAPVHYLRHIGLEVPVKQLALALYQTYGVGEDFTGHRGRRINVRAYRYAVRNFIPRIAYAVTLLHRGHEPADPATPEALEIRREVAEVATENDWQTYRRKAGVGTYVLAALLFVTPKIGPFKMVAVKGPTEETEAEYLHSVAMSVAGLRQTLARFTPPETAPKDTTEDAGIGQPRVVTVSAPAASLSAIPGNAQNAAPDPHHPLPNRDLDTGRVVQPGGYSLTDSTYAHLLHLLTRKPSEPIPPGIKEDILAYYADPQAPITTKKNAQLWAQVQADLATLKTMPTSPWPEPYPTYTQGGGSAN
jgi:hypothetical protein